MHNSKLVSILKLLSQNELKQFEKFILSPYFSEGRDVSGLFQILKKSYPVFTSPDLNRNSIYKKLFKNEKFNERKLKNLAAALTLLAVKFLIHNRVNINSSQYKSILADEFFHRGNEKLFLSFIKHDEKKDTIADLTEADNYHYKNQLLRLKEKYFISKNRFIEAIPYRLKYTENSLLYHYISYFKRLKDMVIFPIFYNTPFENNLFDAVKESTDFEALLAILKNKNYDMTWLIEIYYCMYKSISQHNEEISESYYYKFKELFLLNIKKFSEGEKCYLFDAMATYCMMREPVNSKFSMECFEVYKRMLVENSYKYSKNDYISITLYGNIMFWAYDLCEFDWLEKFIAEYSNDLRPEHRGDMVNLANAHLFFGRKNYERSLHYINKVQNEFLLYKIQVRNLKFKIFYELNLIEPAFDMIDSFKHFLKNNSEINELFKDRAYDFINIYTILLKAKSDKKPVDHFYLRSKIEKMLGYELRPWLLEKLNELSVLTK